MSKCRFLLLSTFPQQHFSARTAYSIIKVSIKIVRIQPTTTAIATNNSGDKCSEIQRVGLFKRKQRPSLYKASNNYNKMIYNTYLELLNRFYNYPSHVHSLI